MKTYRVATMRSLEETFDVKADSLEEARSKFMEWQDDRTDDIADDIEFNDCWYGHREVRSVTGTIL